MDIVNLGKKSIGYYIKLFLLTPIWWINMNENRKSYTEFKNGLIDHKCDFHGEAINHEKYSWQYTKCKHTGCNIIDPII